MVKLVMCAVRKIEHFSLWSSPPNSFDSYIETIYSFNVLLTMAIIERSNKKPVVYKC